jgi:Rod binding domain-containing protein
MQPVSSLLPGSAAANDQKSDNRRIEKSSREFESLLLSNWLEKAYDSFGTMPGAEDDADLDSGKDQLNSIAMQSLAGAMTASGGIGIAKMIANRLQKQGDSGSSGVAGPGAPGAHEELMRFSAQDAELSARSGR